MTAYQETPIYYVDSPLTQPDDDYYLPWPRSQAADPMAAVQQRMMLVLGASLVFVVLFAMWAIRMGGLSSAATDTTKIGRAHV